MKKLIAVILLLAVVIVAGDAFGGIYGVTQQCEAKGYFIYSGTLFMCVKIRDGVTEEELAAYTREDMKRQAEDRAKAEEQFNQWIKTDEGKAWIKDYRKTHPQIESKE